MALLRLCATFAVLLATTEAKATVTPIEKVVSLLEDLKDDVKSEGENEATAYNKFACFCKDSSKTKSDNIIDSQDKIDQITADIGSKSATREEKITEKKEEQQKVEDKTKELQDETESFNKDEAAHQINHADLSKAVSSAKKAHDVLSSKKGAAFLDIGTKSDVQNCLNLADALGLIEPSKHEAVTSFLQVDPDDPAYKFHSDKILGIIKGLQEDFQDQLTKAETEWEKRETSFKETKDTLEGKIQTAKDQIETLNGDISTLDKDIAKLKDDLVETNATLEDDSTYLKDLTVRCEEKGRAWDQRTKTRNDEMEALTKALDILEEKAANADEVNKRALLLAEPPAAPVKAPVKAEAAPAKPAAKPAVKAEIKKTVSFLQVRKARSQKEQTVAFLHHESVRLDSVMLSSVAEQIRKDPFTKIKTLIQGLIERLLAESKAEATKKGFCDTELGKSETDRKNRYADVNKLDAEGADLEAHKMALDLEIKELGEQLDDEKEGLHAKLTESTDLRKEEKEDNEETIQKAQDGAKAVAEALTILQDFYKSASKETTSLLQVAASPVDEDSPGAGFGDAYKGSQGKSNSILGLLEVIKSDYERTEKVTEANEKEALAKFVELERSLKSDIGAKTTKKELDEQDLESTKSAIDTNMEDLKTATDLLDKALINIEDLKPTCIDTGMSYADRVAKREEEIKALNNAHCMLIEGNKPVDCPAS